MYRLANDAPVQALLGATLLLFLWWIVKHLKRPAVAHANLSSEKDTKVKVDRTLGGKLPKARVYALRRPMSYDE